MATSDIAFNPNYFQIPTQQLDLNGNPINPYTQTGTGALPSQPAFNPTRDDSVGSQVASNRQFAIGTSQQLGSEDTQNLQYYGPEISNYNTAQNAALNDLANTPGYTNPEASQINTDYSRFNTPNSSLDATFLSPTEQQEVFGNPYAAKTGMDQSVAAEGKTLNDYQSNLSGQLQNYGTNLSGQTGNFQTGAMTAAGQLQSGLQGAQSGFGKLDAAVNDPNLAFDPNATEHQMSDQDVQNIKTAAGSRIGNQYQSAEDQLQRQAAAAGNASPLAIGAANARLQHQEASDQGNAELNADISARQAQYDRAATIEAQREQTAFGSAGLRSGAYTTEQSQAQNAAALGGEENLAAAEASGQAGINAANQYGAASINAANTYGNTALGEEGTMANQSYAANAGADNTSSTRAAQLVGNRQATQQNVNNTQYAQGTGSQQLTSAGAQTVGNARIAGQGAYRSGVAGQQQMAMGGAQSARQGQQATYTTTAGALGQGSQTLGGYKSSAPTATGQATGLINAVLNEGGIVDTPTIAIVGEKQPEMIMELGPRSRYRGKDRMAA